MILHFASCIVGLQTRHPDIFRMPKGNEVKSLFLTSMTEHTNTCKDDQLEAMQRTIFTESWSIALLRHPATTALWYAVLDSDDTSDNVHRPRRPDALET